MKKLILTVLLIITMSTMFSQSRILSTYEVVLKEFPRDEYGTTTEMNDDGERSMVVKLDFANVLHLFTVKGYCYATLIKPKDMKTLNWYVEKYNKEYVRVSDTEWKAYFETGIAKIELIFEDNNLYYFKWTLIK